jgi:predicted CXXCH cytochrome family protein
MSKLRISFQAVVMLLVLSLFSAVAFAAAPAAPTGFNSNTSGENGVIVTWKAVTGATSYKVYWNGSTTAENAATATYTKTGLEAGKKYSIAVSAVNATAEESTKTTFEVILGLNNTLTSTDLDNGQINANQTGSGVTVNDGSTVKNVIKSQPLADNPGDRVLDSNGLETGHRTHGEYQNNTNSCASCHQTHTAASKNLLFKNGVYATCTACHDGTLGFYNVFNESGAGTFGGTHDGNMSVHLANGTVANSAAPGGNRTSSDASSWGAEFNCASCHAPHGSYSDRLLHYSPNGMGNVATAQGGLKLENVPVVNSISGQTADYILLIKTLGATDVATDAAYEGETEGSVVVQMMKKNGTNYDIDPTPWLYGYTGNNPKVYWTFLKKDTTQYDYGTTDTSGIEFKFGKGYAISTSDTGKTNLEALNTGTGTIARAYVVKFSNTELVKNDTLSNILKVNIYDSKHQGRLNSTTGKTSSAYCSACHTDYFAKSGTSTGTWNQAFRHTTNNGSYNCLLCHFAHGTDVTVMSDAEGHTVAQLTKPVLDGGKGWTPDQALDYMRDKSPSSALKRFTNMSVCWACHTSSKAAGLKNNEYYQNTTDEVPHGLPPVATN